MTVDMEKVRQKLQFMRAELQKLARIKALGREQFIADQIYQYAATRMLQITIEAMLDLCAHIAVREGWGLPKTYQEAVALLAQHDVIPRDMEATYLQMARLRNRVVHLYDQVDGTEIWQFINDKLDDFKPFILNIIKRYLPAD